MNALHPQHAGPFLSHSPSAEAAAVSCLGWVRFGVPAAASAAQQLAIGMPVLGGHADEIWLGGRLLASGDDNTEGCTLCWREDAGLLFGTLQLDEANYAAGAVAPLRAATTLAYRKIFALLRARGFMHLARVWNYFADINAASQGLERYRHFNIGRHEAFISDPHWHSQRPPVASALGLKGPAPLSVYFLASRTAPQTLENPRQVAAYQYPHTYGPKPPRFSRACLLPTGEGPLLLIAGTASIVGHASVHAGDITAQTEETLRNLRTLIAAANARLGQQRFAEQHFDYKVYLRHAGDLVIAQALLARHFSPSQPASYLQADICRQDLLIEIEAVSLPTPGAHGQ